MDERTLFAIVFLVAFGLIFGAITARFSLQREAVHGGAIAHLFHYLAASIWAALVPTVLVSVIVLRLHLLQALGIVVILVLITLLLLFPYAAAEKPHLERLAQREDRGWTEEDARTSGL